MIEVIRIKHPVFSLLSDICLDIVIAIIFKPSNKSANTTIKIR